MTRKILTLTLALVMILSLALTGCQSGTGKTTTAAATTAAATTAAATTAAATTAAATTAAGTGALDAVTLTWYNASGAFAPDAGQNRLKVADHLNTMFQEKINATVDYKWWGAAEYEQNATAALSAGQPMDVLFTSISRLPFGVWYNRGAFAPITDLLKEYAPITYSSIPEYVWNGASVKGEIYAMPTYKDVAVTMGLIYNKSMMEELGMEEELLGIKWSVAKELDEFYYKVRDARDAAHPEYVKDKIPLNILRDTLHIYFEADQLSSLAYNSIPGTPSFVEDEYANGTKVFNVYASQEYADAIKLVTKWVTDGIVPYDQRNWDTEGVIRNSGKMFSRYTWGLVAVDENQYENYKQGLIQPTVAFTYTGYIQAVMQAIAAASENKERAMMLMELVFSDVDVSTTLRFGIEDEYWKRVQVDGKDRVDFKGTLNENKETRGTDGFYLWYHAEQGNLFTCLLPVEQDSNFFVYLDQMNNSAAASPSMGFVVDNTAIENEVSACASVITEYNTDLITGMVTDVDARLADFAKKLNDNGAEKIVAEVQSQLDAWRAEQ